MRYPIGFSTLGCPKWPWPKVLEQAAAMGYSSLEIRGIEGDMDLPKRPEFAARRLTDVRKDLAARDLVITDLGASARLHERDPRLREQQLDEARRFIDLAHNLGVKVVAEGVEDAAALAMLIDYGCDAAQGYYFSRPMTAAAAERWFESSAFGMSRVPAGEAPVESARPLRLAPRPRADAEKPTIILRLLEIASALSPAEDEAITQHDEADETAA